MRVVVVGCGRVGASISETLAGAGHDVTVLDIKTDAFGRLPPDFAGTALRGDGTDEDVLRRVGTEGADLFLALTEGDNRNVLAAQLAVETFGVQRSVAKVNDPLRADAYTTLGIATICRTSMLADALAMFAGVPSPDPDRGVRPVRGQHGSHHEGSRGDRERGSEGSPAPEASAAGAG
jgi:trk system potassium uptake protein TrkA